MKGLSGAAKRISRMETGKPRPSAPTYHCIVDGEPAIMTELDIAFAVHAEGRQVQKLRRAGVAYLDGQCMTTEEVTASLREAAEEYNSPESITRRKAEYAELLRIGELRRTDFMQGRDMDECHPLPGQKGGKPVAGDREQASGAGKESATL